ncbi:MAG: N-acetylmuramoyl-L-alanine amidase, partial [Acutalibacteraceae bacterium]
MKKLIILIISVILSTLIFIYSCFNPLFYISNVSNYAENNGLVIIIDAGHGGFDGGAVSIDGTAEKDINLKITLYLNEMLKSFGYKTVLTRDKDTSLENDGLTTIKSRKTSDIHNRMKIMESIENSIFVSIHQNKYTQEKYWGTQVFYSPTYSNESILLAESIQKSVVTHLQPENTRIIKECGSSVYLMYKAVKPAVLVECG